ncbi:MULTISPECIES: alpha/beta hydrolase [unclassified Crossiella]|uniref:alpha/beta hydrolase n=1 Tax=unclassified Crossiella TaxID=2620835 RepID=UPI001FFF9F65|nr:MULTISPECIES: alpha/beta hydrolase [unclassified Crossiella]MCK2236521.1 alpha/beta hydrolase family protein [Crossiella sp. S99.2]MCK2250188.1 alpha/beta hydrolase family protein [Crossiella sp. S99.1]
MNPEALYQRMTGGDPARLAEAADPLTGAVSAVDRAGESVRHSRAAAGSWTGAAGVAFTERGDLSRTAAGAAGSRLRSAVAIVHAAVRAQQSMRTGADRAIAIWRGRSAGADPLIERELAATVVRALETVRAPYTELLRSLAGALDRLAPGFGTVAGQTPEWQALPVHGLAVPPAGSDPRQVAAWWAGLSTVERERLLLTQYDQLGRLRGLPAPVLDAANRRRITEDGARFRGALAEADRRLTDRARELGLDPADTENLRNANDPALSRLLDERAQAQRQVRNTDLAADRLAEAERLAGERGIPREEVLIMAWEPDGPRGQGGLAVAFGNPDKATDVAVCVPGTGSGLGGFSLGQAANLRAEMDAASPGGNATIQWLGYDAPDAITNAQVSRPDQAIEGAARLVADVDGYRAAAEHRQHLTVIGHSYGSTVAGYAGMTGLAADELAFVGSPGVGAASAAELPGRVWAGMTEHDPVVRATDGSWFTANGANHGPYDEQFGARGFGASEDSGLRHAHSAYFDQGSESLRNLGNIATGQPERVTGAGPGLGGELGEAGGDLWDGGGRVIGNALDGNWDAARNAAADTGRELLNDLGDAAVSGAGRLVESSRDLLGGLGRLF